MAIILVQKNVDKTIWRMAANQADLDDYNGVDQFDQAVLDDADFQLLRTNEKVYDGATNTVVDPSVAITQGDTATQINAYLANNVKRELRDYTDNNQGKQFATQTANYLTYLESIDVDSMSLTYPLNWELYCSDNGITFLHPLQIG
jgi:preprotein translocase subunit SecD